jgi:hypothetical protein
MSLKNILNRVLSDGEDNFYLLNKVTSPCSIFYICVVNLQHLYLHVTLISSSCIVDIVVRDQQVHALVLDILTTDRVC